jgi:hypothetical protein
LRLRRQVLGVHERPVVGDTLIPTHPVHDGTGAERRFAQHGDSPRVASASRKAVAWRTHNPQSGCAPCPAQASLHDGGRAGCDFG